MSVNYLYFASGNSPLLQKTWKEANEQERRKLLLIMLDAVYFETKITKSIVLIKSKPPFRPIFQVAVRKAGSDICIINEPSRYKVENPPVFVVETGEGRTPRPKAATQNLLQA